MVTVYIIRSEEGYIYIGQTNDFNRRLKEHNSAHSRWTKRGNNWVLLYQENHETRTEAVRRERWLKTGVGRKWIQEMVSKLGS
ncbi:MAG: GIY-YIG nuclease family protein [Candidatus Neomarinimicrobiota bacterium]